MRIETRFIVTLLALGLLLAGKSHAREDDLTRPDWLVDLSAGAKESYDDNVFLGGADARFLPARYTTPAGSVAALKNIDSFITTLSPRVGINGVPWFGDQSVLKVLSLTYSPDFVTCYDAPSESYNTHRLGTVIAGKLSAWAFRGENGFTYIDGSKFGPTYPGAFYSGFATRSLRERREQTQERSTVMFQYDQESWLVRPTGALLYYDLRTKQLSGVTGYQNYSDRYDVNGGADLGYKIDKDLAATLGYRAGSQYQEAFSVAIDPFGQTASSDYQRILMGLEGKPARWLDFKFQAGPDFRHYDEAAPVADHNPAKYYGEGVLTAAPTKSDTVSVTYRQWQWVSGTGKVPYFDSAYDLSYRRELTRKLSGTLATRLQNYDYSSAESLAGPVAKPVVTANLRNDWLYTFSAGLRYAFTANLSADLSGSLDLARNAQDDLPVAQQPESKREFTRRVILLGVQVKL